MNSKVKQHKDLNMIILDYCKFMEIIAELYEINLKAGDLLLMISKFRILFNQEVMDVFNKHKKSVIYLLKNKMTDDNIEEYLTHLNVAFLIVGEILTLGSTELLMEVLENEEEFNQIEKVTDEIVKLMNVLFED